MATSEPYQGQTQHLDPTSRNDNGTMEKDYGNGAYHLHDQMDHGEALRKIQTSGSLSISPELFEKIYLSPQNKVSGDLRKTFANPTPLALSGFLLSLTPLSCILMGWRGAGGSGASDTAVYFFFGGILMLLGALGEFLLGNTFPMVVFGTFGAFWLSFGGTLQPFFNAYGAYSTTGTPADGLTTVGFNASFAFFQLFMGLLCLVYSICALRTNIVLFLILFLLVPAFGCLAGAYWQLALGNATFAGTLLVVAGALTFVVDMLGWWLFTSILLASMDFPLPMPVGDLSRFIKGYSEKSKRSEEALE